MPKNLKSLGSKVNVADRAKVESSVNELKEVLKSNDKHIIETKINNLNDISSKILSNINKESVQ